MESIIFKDGMKKIACIMIVCSLPFFALAINSLIHYLNPKDGANLTIEMIKIVFFLLIACILIFYFIYALTYTVIGSDTKITFKVFTYKKAILIRDITAFKLHKYFPTGYYQFYVDCNNQPKNFLKITISTKNVSAFVDLLKSFGIEQL